MRSKNILLVIDMQNDFIGGSLGNKETEAVVEKVASVIEKYKADGYEILFTRDTHDENYLHTQEGKLLPVKHCLKGSQGWQIVKPLQKFIEEGSVFDKPSFGSLELPLWIKEKTGNSIGAIVICGVCTDICVISNAMILKSAFPEIEINIESECCAGVTAESHENALLAMKQCQIGVI